MWACGRAVAHLGLHIIEVLRVGRAQAQRIKAQIAIWKAATKPWSGTDSADSQAKRVALVEGKNGKW